MEKSDSKMIRLCGLWKGKSKSGTTYISGKLGGARVFIFPVREKRGGNSPDYTLYIAPDDSKNDKQSPAPSAAEEAKSF